MGTAQARDYGCCTIQGYRIPCGTLCDEVVTRNFHRTKLGSRAKGSRTNMATRTKRYRTCRGAAVVCELTGWRGGEYERVVDEADARRRRATGGNFNFRHQHCRGSG